MRNKKLRALAESAVLVAVAFVLSFLEFEFWPNGGSIGVTMVPLVVIGVRWGLLTGTGAGAVFGLIKGLQSGGLSWGIPSLILDYVIAFALVGLGAGLFSKKKNGALYGIVLGTALRFIAHFISGVTLFRIASRTEVLGVSFNADAFVFYSFFYNITYMFVSLVLCFIILFFINRQMGRYLRDGIFK